MPACRNERDVELQHFEGKQFAVVKTLEYVVTKFLVWLCVWGSVAVQHWLCGDVSYVKLERDLDDVKSGVEKGNVGDVVMGRELDGSEICDGLKMML